MTGISAVMPEKSRTSVATVDGSGLVTQFS